MKSRLFLYYADPLFILSLAAYAANRLFIKPHWSRHWFLGPFIHDHFNDSLLVPVALPIFLGFYRLIHLRTHDQPPSLREVLGHVALWSFYFEVFAPYYLRHGTADVGDALSYLVGGLFSWAGWQLFYGKKAVLDSDK